MFLYIMCNEKHDKKKKNLLKIKFATQIRVSLFLVRFQTIN
jgi:hypothetical protein